MSSDEIPSGGNYDERKRGPVDSDKWRGRRGARFAAFERRCFLTSTKNGGVRVGRFSLEGINQTTFLRFPPLLHRISHQTRKKRVVTCTLPSPPLNPHHHIFSFISLVFHFLQLFSFHLFPKLTYTLSRLYTLPSLNGKSLLSHKYNDSIDFSSINVKI